MFCFPARNGTSTTVGQPFSHEQPIISFAKMTPLALTATSASVDGLGAPELQHTQHFAPHSHSHSHSHSDSDSEPQALRARKSALEISIPDVEAADDGALVSAIVRLANVAFLDGEAGIWTEGYNRTSAPQIELLLRNQQLALGYLNAENPSANDHVNSAGQQLVACVCVKQQSSTHGSFSMLVLDKRYWGLGMGNDIIEFAEQRCRDKGCSIMIIDIIIPTTFKHPFKTRLREWYMRLGYELVRLADFGKEYPELWPLLAGPIEFQVFEKKLC